MTRLAFPVYADYMIRFGKSRKTEKNYDILDASFVKTMLDAYGLTRAHTVLEIANEYSLANFIGDRYGCYVRKISVAGDADGTYDFALITDNGRFAAESVEKASKVVFSAIIVLFIKTRPDENFIEYTNRRPPKRRVITDDYSVFVF